MVGFVFRRSQPGVRAEPRGRRVAASVRARGFRLIATTFISLLLVSLAASWAAIGVVNSLRAYGVGEGRYSKGQKIAVIDLNRYIYSGDPRDYAAFLTALAVPQGDRAARVALQSRPVDIQAARAGFLQGNNHPDDVESLISLFRRFDWWGPFAKAIADWTEGDRLVSLLADEGDRIRRMMAAGALTPQSRAAEFATIEWLDDQLTDRENTFSTHMGEGARTATALVVGGVGGTTVLLWAIGMAFAGRLFRQQLTLDRQLSASEQRFRDYAEVASDWYWEIDDERRITYVSERFFAATGADPASVLGRDAAEFVLEHSSGTENEEQLRDLSLQLPMRGLRLRYLRAAGDVRYLSLSAKPYRDEVGGFLGYRGVGSDVTSAVEDAMVLREAKERADLANRAKSEFLANMSHELRTPLNAIIGFSDVIQQQMLGPDASGRYESYVGDINNSGRHLLSIINDILDLSKIEAGREELSISDIGLDEIVASTETLFAGRFEQADLKLTIEMPTPTPTLSVDARKMKQCLANLLSNALKFTPVGGVVRVAAKLELDGGVTIAVHDTGIGIAAKHIPTALAPFGQVESPFRRVHNGTGLGLPITRALIELHGGNLALESELGMGTIVTLTIPPSRIVAHAGREEVRLCDGVPNSG